MIVLLSRVANILNIISISLIRLFKFKFLAREPIEIPKMLYRLGFTQNEIPKKIWVFWDDIENMPLLVKKCIEKIKYFNNDFDVIILSNANIASYIPTIEYFNFPRIQHKSDYIRLYLLKKYGGIWVDASIMFYEPLDYFFKIMDEKKSNFFAFYNEHRTQNFNYPIIENWFLIASKEHKFISAWLEEYEFALKIGARNYVNLIAKKHPEFFHRIDNSEREYMFNYICAQKTLRKYSSDYIFLSCDETAFYYHYTGSWRFILLGLKFFHYTNLIKTLTIFRKPKKNPILIKLVAGDRYQINSIILDKNYHDNTLLSEFLGDK